MLMLNATTEDGVNSPVHFEFRESITHPENCGCSECRPRTSYYYPDYRPQASPRGRSSRPRGYIEEASSPTGIEAYSPAAQPRRTLSRVDIDDEVYAEIAYEQELRDDSTWWPTDEELRQMRAGIIARIRGENIVARPVLLDVPEVTKSV